jgi:putative DNA primase/helicase
MQDNIFKSAESKICLSLIEKYFSAPKAKYDKRRNEYFTLSPLRADEHVKAGTFSINVNTGLWSDLATGDKGNFIQLVQKKFNLSALDAAKKIIQDSGGIVMDDKRDERKTTQADKKPAPIIPIPVGVAEELNKIVQNQYNQDAHGKAVRIYVYKNYDGDAVLCVCRYEKEIDGEKDKEHIPYYYSKKGWRAGRPDIKKYPLYNEDKLKENDLPVLVVEGEKCGNIKVDGYVVVSWLGGTGSVELADWEILQNRKVIIWPDNDEPGMKAAMYIKKILPKAEILDMGEGMK